jgi:hypothetical protein
MGDRNDQNVSVGFDAIKQAIGVTDEDCFAVHVVIERIAIRRHAHCAQDTVHLALQALSSLPAPLAVPA